MQDALLNSNSYETTTLDSGDMFSKSGMTTKKTSVKSKDASIQPSEVCQCKRMMCHVCNDGVQVTGETTFVPVHLLGAPAELPESTSSGNLLVVPNFNDMEKALANGDWELLATFANELSGIPDANVEKSEHTSAIEENISCAPTTITDLKSIKDIEIQALISDQAWQDVAELASCIAKGEALAADIQKEERRPKSAR